jgi:hypothetical protein
VFDGYYAINLEVNKTLADIPAVKTTDHKSRGMDITRTLNGVVQNTANQAIYLNAKTPDGRTIFEVAEVVDTNVGHYMLTYPDSMVNVAGSVSIELMIVDPTGTISTNTGTVNVVQAVSNYEDVISDLNYPALLKALNSIQDMQAQITAMQTQVDNIEKFDRLNTPTKKMDENGTYFYIEATGYHITYDLSNVILTCLAPFLRPLNLYALRMLVIKISSLHSLSFLFCSDLFEK